MSKCLIYFECDPANVGTILGKIGPDMALVSEFRVETAVEKPKRVHRKDVTRQPEGEMRYYNNSRVQGVFMELLNAFPKEKGVLKKDIERALVREGLSAKSHSPAGSYLVRAGVIRRDSERYYLV